MKGKSKTGRKEARKKAVKGANLKEFIKEFKEIERQEENSMANGKQQDIVTKNKPYSVFDRFQKKNK